MLKGNKPQEPGITKERKGEHELGKQYSQTANNYKKMSRVENSNNINREESLLLTGKEKKKNIITHHKYAIVYILEYLVVIVVQG